MVRHFCDRIAVMHHGRLVEQSPRDELFAAPHTDYTRSLLAARPLRRGGSPDGGSGRRDELQQEQRGVVVGRTRP
ncbi:hypothetical protein GCM10020229_28160 [Kitasatospora albolonga]